MKLNIGCGSQAEKGYVNVDAFAQPGVDVVHDLDVFPWPFDDNSVDHIKAFDVYEHVEKPLHFMVECWRVLKPGGTIYIHTAFWKNRSSFNDPTHKRFLTEDSFGYWTKGHPMRERYGVAYSLGREDVLFDQIDVHLDFPGIGDLNVTLRKI